MRIRVYIDNSETLCVQAKKQKKKKESVARMDSYSLMLTASTIQLRSINGDTATADVSEWSGRQSECGQAVRCGESVWTDEYSEE